VYVKPTEKGRAIQLRDSNRRDPGTLVRRLAEELQEQILSGALRRGDRLPSERELGTRYGLSRNVVREAVKLLSERGLVASQTGRGTFVADGLNSDAVATSLELTARGSARGYSDLVAVRRLIEHEVVRLAAANRDEDDLAELEAAHAEMDRALDHSERFVSADQRFHRALAQATKNQILVVLIDAIVDVLQESRRLIYRVEGAPERGQQQHSEILAAIRDRDPGRAGELMHQHLQEIARDIDLGMRKVAGGSAPGTTTTEERGQ
jgi:GntR family transcriptional repressor for pyruvate dehydrogenase complex